MNIPEILSNEALRRHEFPVTAEHAFFAHAGVCPLPRRVQEATSRYLSACGAADQEACLGPGFFSEVRTLAARLLHAQPGEIALVGPTSQALSLVANGLSFRRHENAVVYLDDYPSNVYPWMTLADRGVEVRFLNVRELGVIRYADVIGQVDEGTRLVALASCHFVSGWRLELDRIGKALRERGILFCVDGIQTLGAFPTTVEHVDMLAADAHKWMLGPCAAGLLYIRQEVQDRLLPTVYGWHNLACPDFVTQEELVFKDDARRYEAGTANLLGLVGMKAALELLLEVGVDAIAAELRRKRAWLVAELRRKGAEVLCAGVQPEHAGGITSFRLPDADMAEVHRRLLAAGVVTSLRRDRAGRQFVRLSPHFYNTDAELARAVEAL